MKLRLSKAAQNDLEDIWLYIAQDDPGSADRFVDLLGEKFVLLAHHPDAGRSCKALEENLRCFPVGRYMVFYRHTPPHLEIVRILHAARDIESCFDPED